jgi:phosphatidylserine decarboxylase
MRFAPEAWNLVGPLCGLTMIAFCIAAYWHSVTAGIVGIALAVLSLAVLMFFRDPERQIPTNPGAVVSPADGHVLFTETMPDGRQHIAIFLSVLDVHVNRAPFACTVQQVASIPGSYFHAGKKEAEKNARVDVSATCVHGSIAWRQVSGSIARKISCRAKPGDQLEKGARFGLIYFGSRMDVYLPAPVRFTVQPHMPVRAGETIIAEFFVEGSL